MISYKPFFKTLEKKGISQYELLYIMRFSGGTLDSLRKNKNITLGTLEKICQTLKCKPCDVFEFVDDVENTDD